MHGLEQGIRQLANHEMNQTIRSKASSLLSGIIDDLNAGIKVWEDFLSSGNLSSEAGAFGGWAGFSIENQLWELELEARDKAREASNGRSSLDRPLIELAYNKLEEGQTASERCNVAIEAMNNRINAINELIALIKNTKPKKAPSAAATKKSTSKSSAAKKPAKKKPAKKKSTQKKQAAKKKAAKKKAAKKKATKKKATKKKATKKKATKKKAAKKKAAKKKAAKKKTTKKKAGKKKTKKKAKRR